MSSEDAEDGATVMGLAHVGVIVPNLAPAKALFERLGLEVLGPEAEPDLGLEALWVRAGSTVLEFIAPAESGSRAAKAIERGEVGVHHVALAVEGLEELLGQLEKEGIPIRDRIPRRGAHGTRISFLDPAAAGGALVELVEDERK